MTPDAVPAASAGGDFTEPTLDYWQELHREVPARFSPAPPHRFGYPVRLPDGRVLVLPLRAVPPGERAVASLIANQASYAVVSALAGHMADLARGLGAGLVVGLPTLGLAFAAGVAERLGQPRYVPLGYSRKFWYRDDLSEPVVSLTSPEPGKRLRIDPNLLPLLQGRRVVVVDDAISTGATALAAIRLLGRLGIELAGVVVAMKQTRRWEAALAALAAEGRVVPPVRAVFAGPQFERRAEGWWPVEGTLAPLP
ncbi:phosphoribosyltransferase [Ancylobacter lacus]|uniref:phosphoribosyltransferase n=1 Tax=Ancylobacter lacus TaxID=2579970 RepID=UPI001BCBBB05|nr:phosphoribosyltransferase [Ancylobacter lacus]MBS7538949.1 phosphoribosyltransferase [Ancylobacter lacus]